MNGMYTDVGIATVHAQVMLQDDGSVSLVFFARHKKYLIIFAPHVFILKL